MPPRRQPGPAREPRLPSISNNRSLITNNQVRLANRDARRLRAENAKLRARLEALDPGALREILGHDDRPVDPTASTTAATFGTAAALSEKGAQAGGEARAVAEAPAVGD